MYIVQLKLVMMLESIPNVANGWMLHPAMFQEAIASVILYVMSTMIAVKMP